MIFPTLEAAYWISPKGKFFLVEGSHIGTVCNHPAKFGTDEESLKVVFEKHNEPYCIEGTARKRIILCLVGKGWIRGRSYGNRGWTVNVASITPRTKMRLTDFFTQLYGEKLGYDDVKIDYVGGPALTSVPKILAFDLFGGKAPRNLSQHRLTYLDSASLIPDDEVVRVTFS